MTELTPEQIDRTFHQLTAGLEPTRSVGTVLAAGQGRLVLALQGERPRKPLVLVGILLLLATIAGIIIATTTASHATTTDTEFIYTLSSLPGLLFYAGIPAGLGIFVLLLGILKRPKVQPILTGLLSLLFAVILVSFASIASAQALAMNSMSGWVKSSGISLKSHAFIPTSEHTQNAIQHGKPVVLTYTEQADGWTYTVTPKV